MSRSAAVVILWLRRDLRVADNAALRAAMAGHRRVLPLYIHAPDEEAPWQPGAASRWWLHHSLAALGRRLERLGAPLIVRGGPSLATLLDVAAAAGARAVYWNRLYEPAIVARDRSVERGLAQRSIETGSFAGHLLAEPGAVVRGDGQPYRVFTPFWRTLRASLAVDEPLRAPRRIAGVEARPASLTIDDLGLLPARDWAGGLAQAWMPGEDGARKRLGSFVARAILRYAACRDLPAVDGVSRLSPHLHFGELSPRQAWTTAMAAAAGRGGEDDVEAWLRQLAWREFANHLMFHFPHTPQEPFHAEYAQFPWRESEPRILKAWQRGRTGIPLVDAGMRELWTSGWMHNRVRMVVASFLTRNAGIHWLEGARWFWDTLVDADLANNTLGWQWSAGCGADAAPYFRVFNPVRQGQRFDPDGDYVRRWVPELAALPGGSIHEPARAPDAAIDSLEGYPESILDLHGSRAQALARFERFRGRARPRRRRGR